MVDKNPEVSVSSGDGGGGGGGCGGDTDDAYSQPTNT